MDSIQPMCLTLSTSAIKARDRLKHNIKSRPVGITTSSPAHIDESIQAECNWYEYEVKYGTHKHTDIDLNSLTDISVRSTWYCPHFCPSICLQMKMARRRRASILSSPSLTVCQSLGSLVAIYNTAWSWDIIIVHCLIFHLHYTLLHGSEAVLSLRESHFSRSIFMIVLFVSICRPFHKLLWWSEVSRRETGRDRAASLKDG